MSKILLLAIFLNAVAQAKIIEGSLVLWEKKPCLPNTKCELPKPVSQQRPFSFDVTVTNTPGTYPSTPVLFDSNEFKVQIEFFSVKKENQKPYFIAQMYLSHAHDGLIAQCSNYVDIAVTDFFPVGSCSGIYKDKQIGMSFFKPIAFDK